MVVINRPMTKNKRESSHGPCVNHAVLKSLSHNILIYHIIIVPGPRSQIGAVGLFNFYFFFRLLLRCYFSLFFSLITIIIVVQSSSSPLLNSMCAVVGFILLFRPHPPTDQHHGINVLYYRAGHYYIIYRHVVAVRS